MNGTSLPPSPTPLPAVGLWAEDIAEVRAALALLSRRVGWVKGDDGQQLRAAFTDADRRLARIVEEMTPPAM